jgi:glycosyltransferase involved in cell wall biosynthesis
LENGCDLEPDKIQVCRNPNLAIRSKNLARTGMNPARNRVSEYAPARVTVAVLVYLPYQQGYFEHRMDVVKLCLQSIVKNTRSPYDLLVFDNGSCPEAKQYLTSLLQEGTIRYLITANENIGKIGAFKIIFNAAPGEIIAYADDDIFHYPGWLEEHLRIMDHFPGVGMVSGAAVRTLWDHAHQSNLRLAREDPEVKLIKGQRIPREWEIDWAESYGRDPQEHVKVIQSLEDFILERDGLQAFAIANHNQFVTPKQVLTSVLPSEWSGRLMGEMYELDNAVDEAGYLRLSTLSRTTRHIGNTINAGMAADAKELGIEIGQSGISTSPRRKTSWLVRWKPMRWLLQGLYNRLFWILSHQQGTWLRKED